MNEQDPLIQKLADANPVPHHRVDGASREPSANDLLVQLTQRPRRRILGPSRWPAPPRVAVARGVRLVGAVLVVALVVGALVLRGGERAPATASELLLRTAMVAGEREPAVVSGTYLYRKVQADQPITGATSGMAWSAVLPVIEETWVAADGSGRSLSEFGNYRFFGPRDRVRWRAAGSPPIASGTQDSKLPPGLFLYKDVNSLPTQGDQLLDHLREEAASRQLPSDVAVLIQVGELLARGDAEPAIRSALYRVVARLPGVELLDPREDPLGRAGVAVGITYDESGSSVRVVLIFDQETSELLAEERYLLEPASWVDADPGTRLSYIAYLESGRTDSISERPAPQS